MKTEIWISLPDGIHNNYGLQVYSRDRKLIAKAYQLFCNNFLGPENQKLFRTFQQGLAEDWIYFEFWNDTIYMQDCLFDIALSIANKLNLELNIR